MRPVLSRFFNVQFDVVYVLTEKILHEKQPILNWVKD